MRHECRKRWLDRQGIRQPGLRPCGECAACREKPNAQPVTAKRRGCRCEQVDPSVSWVRDASVRDIASTVKDLVADGATETADLTLAHAVHVGNAPHDLFSAGGRRRKTTTLAPEPEPAPDPEPEPLDAEVE